jgi:hypothetical protein
MADEPEIPDGKIDNKLLLSILRDIRREQREHLALTLSLSERLLASEKRLSQRIDDFEKRLDQRFGELRDDLELMLKAEVLGRLTHFETRIDQKIEELLAR